MNTRGILRFYLVFTLMISTGALLSYNKKINHTFSNYYASVVHVLDDYVNDGEFKYEDGFNKNYAGLFLIDKDRSYSHKNSNENLINFKIEQDTDKAFAEPGEKDKEIMKLKFKTSDGKFNFDSIKLKTHGIESHLIEDLYLYNNGEKISEGKRNGEYFIFKSIGFNLDPDKGDEIIVKANLSKELKANNRLRLDIEKPEDLGLRVSNKGYEVNEYYPIKGKYLTIISKG